MASLSEDVKLSAIIADKEKGPYIIQYGFVADLDVCFHS